MQVNPQPQQQPGSSNSRNFKKSQKTPYRAQISLKSKRKKNIPQIKIQLDQMLSQAFHQMQAQPKKNIRLGNADLYILDNQLLRNYVTAVYDEYGIEDPLSSIQNRNNPQTQKIKTTKHFETRNYQTPQKPVSNFNDMGSTNSKFGHKVSKTTQRLSKLKRNFQTELQTMPTVLIQDQNNKTYKKGKVQEASKKIQIKVSRRVSQQLESKTHSQKSRQNEQPSYLLVKTRHKYCLMCEQPLQTGLINNHQRQCQQLQKLLNTPNLKIQQITQILTNKIHNLQKQLQFYRNNIHQDVNTLQKIINSTSNNYDVMMQSQEDQDQDHATLIKAFSMLSTVKCMENIDKIKWFKKMKAKAEIKKGVSGII